MVDTRCSSSFYLLCSILIVFPRDSNELTNIGHQLLDNANGHGATDVDHVVNTEDTEEYPFQKAYYSYKVQSNELLKDVRLNPPIDYETPEGYSLVLEKIAHFCQNVDKSIIEKFSALASKDKVYIKVDDDLKDMSTNDSTIVYKLKAIKNADLTTIGGSTTVLVRIVQFLPISDTELAFEEPSYSLKLSYGHKGKVFKFNTVKTTHKAKSKNTHDLEFEKQPENEKYLSKNEYSFKGNYTLEYVPEQLLTKLRVSDDGELEVLGNVDEGYYIFDIVAVDYGPNSTTVLKARSKVYMFIDNVAACNAETSKFIRAFSKHYITEETKLITAVPGTESSGQCRFSISHQFPFGVGADFFAIDKRTGTVHVKSPIDREAYWFEYMEEPSVYLKLRIHCPPVDDPPAVQPLHLPDMDHIVYDPTSTLVQLVIEDTNDNVPVFADKHIVVGYPVQNVANTIIPKHLLQVKATDKDAGKHGKIQYSLTGDDANDFIINSETGTIYCTSLVDDSTANKTFKVVAKNDDGKSDGSESTLAITVKFLTFSDIVRVNVQFSTSEDHAAAIESQLSEISGVRVMSLTNDVINTFVDGQWRTERMLTVYGVNNSDDSLVSASELKKNLEHNSKVFGVTQILHLNADGETSTVMSLVYAAMFFLMLSMVAVGLLYFGYVKNGRYLSCISSPSTTPLKDDIENMSQSNWITTFNRNNLTSNRVRFPGNINSEAVSCRSKFADNATVVVENSLYEAIPPKGTTTAVLASNNNSSIVKLDSKVSFEDDLIKLEKMDEAFSPADDVSFSY